ncbi:hypothetical protein N7488_006223 [Penicillium malachiteum]|nr:hypothetical protein N7488_006223 [Penicillium malachiteum]
MAKICIVLLSFTCFSEFPLTIDEENADNTDSDGEDGKISQYSEGHAFLRHAAMNWVQHAQDAVLDENAEWMPSILSLCSVDSLIFRTWYTVYRRSQISHFPWNTTSLNLAAEFGFENVLDSLLKSGEDPNEPHGYGATPLARSVRRSRRAVELLLDAKADINYHGWEELWHYDSDDETDVKTYVGTPLTMAVLDKNTEMVKFLVERGAKIDFPPLSELTPLQAAYIAPSSQPEIFSLLVQLGANVCFEMTDENLPVDITVLHFTAKYRSSSVLQILLDSDTADVNFQLRAASKNSGAEPVDEEDDNTLILHIHDSKKSLSPSPDTCIDYRHLWLTRCHPCYMIGATPLHFAVENGRVDNVKLLLQNGANPHLKNYYGHTAMDFALEL